MNISVCPVEVACHSVVSAGESSKTCSATAAAAKTSASMDRTTCARRRPLVGQAHGRDAAGCDGNRHHAEYHDVEGDAGWCGRPRDLQCTHTHTHISKPQSEVLSDCPPRTRCQPRIVPWPLRIRLGLPAGSAPRAA
eukprot:194228-Prymnesium_polylepis.2